MICKLSELVKELKWVNIGYFLFIYFNTVFKNVLEVGSHFARASSISKRQIKSCKWESSAHSALSHENLQRTFIKLIFH